MSNNSACGRPLVRIFGLALSSLTVILLLSGSVEASESSRAIRQRPHRQRQGTNLASNPNADSAAHWHVAGDAAFDASVSRTADGSGSFRLSTPYKIDPQRAGRVASDLIPVPAPGKYTLGFFAKTAHGPTDVGAQVGIHDRTGKFIRNLPGVLSGTTTDGRWEECALAVFVPEEAAFVQLKIHKADDTRPGGRVWVDEIYFGAGLGLARPPAAKRPFNGGRVRVDELGNFEVKRDGRWTPFFPLCMYSDNRRDPVVYSQQGWNVIIWTSTAASVRPAKEAVSEFNPDGMLAGFQISQYTFPSGWAYNQLDDLRQKLEEIFDQGLNDHLLLYYWDNENNYDQWKVPVDVIQTIRSVERQRFGRLQHPVYALQGNYGLARVHAARGLVDISGTYVGGGADATGGAGTGDVDGLWILDRLEGQTSPAAFAQFNGVDGPGDMRLRLYNAILLGAKAIGYWRDCYGGCSEKHQQTVGPVDRKPWWPDFPNLRREIDRLLPIIREPHWTSWTVTASPRGSVRVGTRQHKDEGYIMLVNQTRRTQKTALTVRGLPYTAGEVQDYFTGRTVAAVHDGKFSVTLRAIGVGSGTQVLRLVPSQNQ